MDGITKRIVESLWCYVLSIYHHNCNRNIDKTSPFCCGYYFWHLADAYGCGIYGLDIPQAVILWRVYGKFLQR
jgi:hypothetical protein